MFRRDWRHFHHQANAMVIVAATFLTILTSARANRNRMYARSISDLQDLEGFEFQITKMLTADILTNGSLVRDYASKPLVGQYLLDFYESCGFAQIYDVTTEGKRYAPSNPVCAYRLIRRVKSLLQDLQLHKSFSQVFCKVSEQIKSFFKENGWPTDEELGHAAFSILRLQHIYGLRAEELASGRVNKIQTNCTLNSMHCEEISKTAVESGQYALAIEWLEVAKEKVSLDKKTSSSYIEELLRNAIQTHNQEIDGASGWQPRFYSRKIKIDIPQDSKSARKKRDIIYSACKDRKDRRYSAINFWVVCSGENLQSEREKSYLFCWYEFKRHPSFAIGPMKIEFLSRNPDIVQIYNVLNEKEMEIIKEESRAKMGPSSTIGGASDSKGKKPLSLSANVRTSVNAWFPPEQEVGLLQKVEHLTGLNTMSPTATERLQVTSYATGGHYDPHSDALQATPVKPVNKDRLATFTFYLNDVEEGGSTCLTSLGVATKPIKGSAVLWYNTYSDGKEDFTTTHGACPVILGEKWAANKWIWSEDQFLVQKCSLRPKERIQFPVNGVYLPVPRVLHRGFLDNFKTSPKNPPKLYKYSYMAPSGLANLAQLEWLIYPRIKSLYNRYKNDTEGEKVQEFQKDVKTYLKDFQASTLRVVGKLEGNIQLSEKVSHNPLAAFKMVNRFLGFLQQSSTTYTPGYNKLLTKIYLYLSKVYNNSEGPSYFDHESAMLGILNIHSVYQLTAKDVAAGYIDGVDAKVKLNADDCFLIGKHAVSLKFYTIGIEWLEHALYLLSNNSEGFVKHEDIVDALVSAQISQDAALANIEGSEPFGESWSRRPEQGTDITSSKPKPSNATHQMRLSRICRGDISQTEKERSKLFCWYERKTYPSLEVGPIKAEWVSMSPVEIVQYHQIISARAITALQNDSIPKFVRHGSQNIPDTNIGTLDLSSLNSIVADVTEKESEVALRTLKLVERITGLKTDRSVTKGLHVTASKAGGHSKAQADMTTFDRIATFVLYLTDVKKGGDTVFIDNGVREAPKKGSAVFWYNLLTSGNPDMMARHGDCPVVFGEKWVATPWITYQDQHHQKCGLNPNNAHAILVNGVRREQISGIVQT